MITESDLIELILPPLGVGDRVEANSSCGRYYAIRDKGTIVSMHNESAIVCWDASPTVYSKRCRRWSAHLIFLVRIHDD